MKLRNYTIAFVVFLFGCSEEATKLEVEKLANWEITNIEDEYRVRLDSVLNISPIINDENFDAAEYDFVWYCYDNNSLIAETDYDTLGVEMNLSCKIDNRIINAIDTEHKLCFKMTNKETGVYYVHRSKLFASGIYGLGTILLCKDGNEYRVHFLRRDSRELMEDVYATEVEPLVNPTKVAFIKPLNRFLPELKEIMIFCDNEDGGVVLDPTTFTKTVSFREKVNAEGTGVIMPRFHFQNSSYDYLIYNGNSCRKTMSSAVYDPVFAVVSEPGTVDLVPMVWKVLQYYNTDWDEYSIGGPIYYDQQNHRFLEHAIELRGYLREMKNSPTSVFDCNNLGDNMAFVCGGALPGIGNGWALMRDEGTNRLYLFKFSTTMEFPIPGNKVQCVITFTGTDKIELTPAYATHLAGAQYFSSIYNVEDGMFVYATENGVYAFNVNQASSDNPTNLETPLVAEQDLDGLKIVGLEYISYEVENPASAFDPFIEKEVRLYTSDESLSDKKSGVLFYKLETLGGLHLQEIYRRSGICDEIVDLEEKYY